MPIGFAPHFNNGASNKSPPRMYETFSTRQTKPATLSTQVEVRKNHQLVGMPKTTARQARIPCTLVRSFFSSRFETMFKSVLKLPRHFSQISNTVQIREQEVTAEGIEPRYFVLNRLR